MGRGAPRSEPAITMLAGGKHTEANEDAGPYIYNGGYKKFQKWVVSLKKMM